MFRHVVMFKWAEGTGESQRDVAVTALRRWAVTAEKYGTVVIGTNAGLPSSSHDVAVVADFPGLAEYERYAADEDHVAMVRDHLAPVIGDRSAVQHTW